MAHRIEEFDRQEGIKQAWHGLTKVLPELSLSNNWLTSWDIVPVKLFRENGVPTRFSLLECSDNQMEIGNPYNPETFNPVTNREFLTLVAESISGGNHKIVSLGSVRNRGRVFVSIELNGLETFKAAGREFSAFLNFGNAHDKSSMLWVNTSNICTVCDNTFGFNLFSVENDDKSKKDDLSLRYRHTKNMKLNFPEISMIIDKAIGIQGKFQIEMDKLANESISESDAEKLFTGFIGKNKEGESLSTRSRNQVVTLLDLFNNGNGNDGNDLSDTFQAVTDFYTHGNGKNPVKQFASSEYGFGFQKKHEFFNDIIDSDRREKLINIGDMLLKSN